MAELKAKDSRKGIHLALFAFSALLTASLGVGLSHLSAEPVPGRGPILIGLDADMSSGSRMSGEAIRRGIVVAIDEINRSGGVLGRPLELVVRDHRGNPARGMDNIEEFALTEGLVAVIGGIHTPVALAEMDSIHRHRIIYLSPWAAGTPIVDNGREPNYAFRVSACDACTSQFLVARTFGLGYKRPALLLENTGWGVSSEKAITFQLQLKGLETSAVIWFHRGTVDFTEQIEKARSEGADVILLVSNSPEGAVLVKSMAALPEEHRLPVISHWGITGGDFFEETRDTLPKVDFVFMQTFSFLDPPNPQKAMEVYEAYKRLFPETTSPRDVFSPVGTAHAYDLVHILSLAIKRAGTTDRPAVRDALERIERYEGLMRLYGPPFTADNHEALNTSDMRLAKYDKDGAIVPVDVR